MKKITMSVAALSIALSMNAQSHNEVTFTRLEVIEMKNTLEDILEWQEYDKERGETGMGSYKEKWGSAYWLTIMRDNLYSKLQKSEDRYEVNCCNCDEID